MNFQNMSEESNMYKVIMQGSNPPRSITSVPIHLTERTVSVIPHQNAKSFRNYRLAGKKESMNS